MLTVKLFNFDKNDNGGFLVENSSLLPIRFNEIKNSFEAANFISFDGLGIDLEDKNKVFYTNGFSGYISKNVSSEKLTEYGYVISDTNEVITLYLNHNSYIDGFTLSFYGNCCSCVKLTYVYNAETPSDVYVPITSEEQFIEIDPYKNGDTEKYATQIRITFTHTPLPNQFIKLNSILIGKVNLLTKFRSSNLLEEINVISEDLPINSFEMEVCSERDFDENEPINVYSNGVYYGTFFVSESQKTGENFYSVKAFNSVNDLELEEFINWDRPRNRGEQQYITLEYIQKEIKDFTNVNIRLLSDRGAYNVFGYLPINTCRYVLCGAAFACCLMVDGSRQNGVSLVEIPQTINSTITEDRIIGDCVFNKSKIITSAEYLLPLGFSLEDTEIELENAADEGVFYKFEDAPIWIEQILGNHIIDGQSLNYINFKSEDGNTTLIGKKITFTYETKTIDNNVTKTNRGEKVKFENFPIRGSFIDANEKTYLLVSDKLSQLQKYIQSRGTAKAKIILDGEKVGDLIQIKTAYDGVITGIITSMNISFGYKDIADIEVMEWNL